MSARRKRVVDAVAAAVPPGRAPVAPVRVAVAAGDHVRSGLGWEWDQTDLHPEAWRTGLAGVDLVVVEVAGESVQGWPNSPTAVEVADAARQLGITAVAWITGPTAPTDAGDRVADAFDAVFVSDADHVGQWRARRPDRRIEAMLPAAQPRSSSPARQRPGAERIGDVFILRDDAAAAAPDDHLDALMAARRDRAAPSIHVWPSQSGAGTAPAISAQYDVFADVSRRAPEATWPVLSAMASRTAVVTTATRAERLPPDLKSTVAVADESTVRRQVTVLTRQAELRDREAHVAHRAVLSGHTFADRARRMLDVTGNPVPHHDRSVSMVVPTNRSHELPNILENAARQVRASTELIVVGHGIEIDRADTAARAKDLGIEHLTVLAADPGLTLGAVLNLGVAAGSGAYVAKMDDDNFYGPDFLGDLLDVFTYTDAGIAGKWAHYVWLRSSGAVVLRFERYEHTYHRLVQGGSIVATRDVARDLLFSDIPRAVDSDFLNRAMAAGVRTYSGDRYNFVSVRGDDRNSHTWKVDDLIFMAGAGRVTMYGDPREHVSA